MRIYENGVYRDATQEEIDMANYQNQQMEMQSLTHDIVSSDNMVKMILSSYNVTLPSGEVVTADKLEDTVIDLPFKAGSKWVKQFDAGNRAFAYVLVDDPGGIGSADNPILLLGNDEPELNGAYYTKNGVRYVYMDGELVEW